MTSTNPSYASAMNSSSSSSSNQSPLKSNKNTNTTKPPRRFVSVVIIILCFVVFTEFIPDRQLLSKFRYNETFAFVTSTTTAKTTAAANSFTKEENELFMYSSSDDAEIDSKHMNHNNYSLRNHHPTQDDHRASSSLSLSSSLFSKSVSKQALDFVLDRQEAFRQQNITWHLHGLGYLYIHHDIILAGGLVGEGGEIMNEKDEDNKQTLQVGEIYSIHIYNVHPQRHKRNYYKNSSSYMNSHGWYLYNNHNDNWCQDFTLYVRVRGSEIIAGLAKAVLNPNYKKNHGDDDNHIDNFMLDNSCYWTFQFYVTTPGEYAIDAKMLTFSGWKGKLESEQLHDMMQKTLPIVKNENKKNETNINMNNDNKYNVTNKMTPTEIVQQLFPIHAGFKGFKLYYPALSCGEFCTRLHPYCLYWLVPAFGLATPNFVDAGCEFFFHNSTPPDIIPKSSILFSEPTSSTEPTVQQNLVLWTDPPDFFHGYPHQNVPAHNFIGCGWSSWYTLDFPCLSNDLDDKVFMIQNNFTVVKDNHNQNQQDSNNNHYYETNPNLPLCSIENEIVFSIKRGQGQGKGRWVQYPWPTNDTTIITTRANSENVNNNNIRFCPNPNINVDKNRKKFEIVEFDPNHPHCWHRDDFRNIGMKCIEINCRFIDNKRLYVSPLKQRNDWYGVWKHDGGNSNDNGDGCNYLEFTTEQLQQCITKRKIKSIGVKGASIAEFLGEYLSQRLEFIEFYSSNSTDNSTGDNHGNGSDNDSGDNGIDDGLYITFDTLALLHEVVFPDEEIARKFQGMKNVTNTTTTVTTTATTEGISSMNTQRREEYYIVTSPFVSSEREVYAYIDRLEYLNQMAKTILVPKGYRVLNYFDMTAAFTYETATQMDGMHIIGPPMKMILTQLFHYTCKDFVEGSIV